MSRRKRTLIVPPIYETLLGIAQVHEAAPGEAAYIEDVNRQPNYHDGSPRKSWEQLSEVERSTWVKNPTPREYGQRGAA